MTRLHEKDIAQLLEEPTTVEPPQNLLESLKAEIPDNLAALAANDVDEASEPAPSSAATGPSPPLPFYRRRSGWLTAATVMVAASGAWLALETWQHQQEAELVNAVRFSKPSEPVAQGPTPEDTKTQEPETRRDDVQREIRALGYLSSKAEPKREAGARSREKSVKDLNWQIPKPVAVAPPPPPPPLSRVLSQRSALAETAGRELQERPNARQKTAVPPSEQRASSEAKTIVRRRARVVPIPDPEPASAEAQDEVGVSGVFAYDNRVLVDGMEVNEGASAEDAEILFGAARIEQGTVPGAAPTAAPSTGGTAEPNDQPYGDMFFESAGVNPFIDTEDDRFSTFGLDVDTGSYGIVRRYLKDGHRPPRDAVRVEEMVNAFDYRDAPPRRKDFAIHAKGAPSPFAEGPRYRLLRLGIKGREISDSQRPPAVLTFVVDVSGSMNRENRLGLVKQSLALLIEELRPDDRLGLVIFGSRGEVVLEPTSDHGAIRRALDYLRPQGSTNAEEGLVLAYGLAEKHFRHGGINRVILCSDGVANVGATGPESILQRIGAAAEDGIELTTLGFGMGNYNDVLMEQLADRGDGRYAYLDTLDEARRVLVEDLTGTLQTIASEARVQLELHPTVVESYRLLGYENRDIADERFRDDTVDAGEIGAGHTVTAVYELKVAPGYEDIYDHPLHRRRPTEMGTLRLRYRSARSGRFEEVAEKIHLQDFAPSFEQADPSFQLAALVAETAEILRGSYWARKGSLDDVLRRLQRLAPDYAGDAQVAEFTALVAQAARLVPTPEFSPASAGPGE